MACFDPKCSCSNAPKCKCQLDWDIRSVCQPSDVWNCPVRVNTAVWLIDNDEDLHILARKRDFEGVRGWFDIEDEVSFHRTVSLYCDQMILELDSEEGDKEKEELARWKQKKIEAELRIIKLAHDEEKKCSDCGKFNKEGSYSEDDEECKNWICEDCYGLYCGCHGKKGCEEAEDEEEEDTEKADLEEEQQKCDCCEIYYPESMLELEGGKYMCEECRDECPCYDPKCGSICPGVCKIVDALATKA